MATLDGPSEAVNFVNEVRDQIRRYFIARYGPNYGYRAPETFPNVLEQWMLAISAAHPEALSHASTLMTTIEQHLAEAQGEA